MAKGITIGEVENVLDGQNIVGTEKIPVSSGQDEPQVVTTNALKNYFTKDSVEDSDDLTIEEIDELLNF